MSELVQIGGQRDRRKVQLEQQSLSPDAISEILRSVPFLSGVREKRLTGLLHASFLRSYEPGEAIVREGEHGHTLFVLLTGAVAVEVIDAQGDAVRVATMQAQGAWFGEGALLGRTRRSATVVAEQSSLLLEIEKTRIEKLEMVHPGVLAKLQEQADLRAIQTYFRQHRGFLSLTETELNELVATSRLEHHARNTSVFKEGDAAEFVYVTKVGVTRLSRSSEGQISVLAYFNAGDVIGLHDDGVRAATLETMAYAEFVAVPRRTFVDLVKSVETRHPDWAKQFHKAEIGTGRQLAIPLADQTMFNFVDELMKDGAQEAQSLLTIDLDLCVRCGNCVRSCEARHGYPKLTRRGKKLERRRNLEVAGDLKPLLFPSSCRHCESPECMIGCPTGAIHRKPTGEVAIHDFCIGCSNCALRCPWDNITMVATPQRQVDGLDTPKIASKCDLCAGFDEANCVHNCPVQAIVRIEPISYFEEVRTVLGDRARAVGGERTTSKAKPGRSRIVATVLGLLAAVGLTALAASRSSYRATDTLGWSFGLVAVVCFLAATALAGRRRLNRFPRTASSGATRWSQLGPLHWWARGHVAFGLVGVWSVVLHSRLQLGGLITAVAFILLALELSTGIFGVLYHRWFPRVVSRLEGESQVEEDVYAERQRLLQRRQQILTEEDSQVVQVVKKACSLPSSIKTLAKKYSRDAIHAGALGSLQDSLSSLESDKSRLVESLTADAVRLAEVRALLALYRVKRGWLVMHIGITVGLLVFTGLHIASVLPFLLGAIS